MNFKSTSTNYSFGYIISDVLSAIGWLGIISIIISVAVGELGSGYPNNIADDYMYLFFAVMALISSIPIAFSQFLKATLDTSVNSGTLIEQNNEIIRLLSMTYQDEVASFESL